MKMAFVCAGVVAKRCMNITNRNAGFDLICGK